jgi:hypothetical protein
VVKLFAWKVANDLLPTKEKLFKRHIVQDIVYPICLQGTEDLYHSLWSYKSFMGMWQECGRKI